MSDALEQARRVVAAMKGSDDQALETAVLPVVRQILYRELIGLMGEMARLEAWEPCCAASRKQTALNRREGLDTALGLALFISHLDPGEEFAGIMESLRKERMK